MRPWLQHLNEIEAPICRAWNQALRHDKVQRLFAIVSRLGDSVFWYSLIAVMPPWSTGGTDCMLACTCC